MAKLGEICTFQSGGTPSKSNPAFFGGSIPWITTVALNGGMIDGENAVAWITDEAIQKSAAKIVPANSIMVGTRVGIGKVAINTVPMSTSQDVVSLTHIDTVRWDKGFLCKFILAKNDFLMTQARGATIKGIKIETLAGLDIPELTLEEQRRIAAVLDKVTDLIAQRRSQLDKLDLLVKSRFVEMFGGINDSPLFPYVPIQELTSVISGGTPNRNNPKYWDGGTIPWVKTTELHNNVIDDTEEKITGAGLENSSAKIVPPNSILIAMYGQGKTRGMTAYLKCQATTNQACACILPSEKINQKYFWQYLMFSYEKLRSLAKGGNQPNLNGEIIKNFPVLFPPIEMQIGFSRFVEQVQKSRDEIHQSLSFLNILKKSLMQNYFE